MPEFESQFDETLQRYQQRLEQKVDQLFEDNLTQHGQSLWANISQQLEHAEACQYSYEDASAYYDHLEAYSEASVQVYETHLPHCADCQEHLRSLDDLIPALHTFYSRWEAQLPVDLSRPVLQTFTQVKVFPSPKQKWAAGAAIAASIALFFIINPLQQQNFPSNQLAQKSATATTSKTFLASVPQEKPSANVLETTSDSLKDKPEDISVKRQSLPQLSAQLSKTPSVGKIKLKPLSPNDYSSASQVSPAAAFSKPQNIQVVVADNLKASPVLQAALQRLVAGTVASESTSGDERRYSIASTIGTGNNPERPVSSPSAEEYLINSNIPTDNSVVMDEASYLITLP